LAIVAKRDLKLFQKVFRRFCRLAGGMRFDEELALTGDLNLALADAALGNFRLGLRPLSAHFHIQLWTDRRRVRNGNSGNAVEQAVSEQNWLRPESSRRSVRG
jgi:hypothetical protein